LRPTLYFAENRARFEKTASGFSLEGALDTLKDDEFF
jgi:hypothetical protein